MSRNRMPPPPPAMSEEHDVKDHAFELDGSPELAAASEPMPEAKPTPIMKKKIKVKALRAGFMHQERKNENDKFEVHEHELGSWMECEDPTEQKKHLARISAKKQKVNKRAVLDHEQELADE